MSSDAAVAPVGHAGFVRTPTAESLARITGWVEAAVDRGHRVVTVALPPDLGLGPDAVVAGLPALSATPGDLLVPDGAVVEMLHRARDEGHRGLAVLVSADGVIASSSPAHHTRVETALTRLCREHPVRVLCLYDRTGVGTDQLDLAVTHHPAELRDPTARVRRSAGRLELAGEFDTSNVALLSCALRIATATATTPGLQIDLSGVRFLSVGAARVLHVDTAAHRAGGGRVQLRGAGPDTVRILRLVAPRGHAELDIVADPPAP